MDSDTMRSSSDYEVVLDKFRRGQLDILVGTQMIAKGLHFPGVTLVGVINADHGLSMPDFRAAERTFQLLTQVAGRAGRGDRRGEVIFQSSKDSEVLQFAANLDFDGFEQYDLEFRQMLNYPPYTRLIAIVFRGEDESALAAFAADFAAARNGAAQIGHSGQIHLPLGSLHGRGQQPLGLGRQFGEHLLL